jgi:hypothetical protein
VWAPGTARFLGASQDHDSVQASALRFRPQYHSTGNVNMAREADVDASVAMELSATGAENVKDLEERMRSDQPMRVRVDWSQRVQARSSG